MKLPIALLALSSLLLTSLGCLHTWGYIVHDPFLGSLMDSGAQVIDNGIVVCDNNWGLRIDQDGHFNFDCLPGFIYAVGIDGRQSWYRNGDNAYSWHNQVNLDKYCCHGACEDKGVKISCRDYSWDTWQFC